MDENKREIKVLIIDDSSVARSLLRFMLESDPQLKVIGTVSNGEEALHFLAHQMPDIITTDLNMPGMDGFETTKRIIHLYPVPIIVISGSCIPLDEKRIFQSLEAGALAILAKPSGMKDPNFQQIAQNLIQTVKTLSAVKVIKRRNLVPLPKANGSSLFKEKASTNTFRAVVIGASMGGPQAIKELLAALPANFPIPIFIVQHIALGFVNGLLSWLRDTTSLEICIAENGLTGVGGKVYIAPDSCHLEVEAKNKILLKAPMTSKEICPSVAHLFRSAANTYGKDAIGVMLTGMGRDGAEELLLMRQKGAYTIAQDEATSIVFGMPKEAIHLGGALHILPLQGIAPELIKLVS